VPAQLAAYLGIAALVAGRRTRSKLIVVQGVGGYILGSAVAFTWGARDAAIFPLALLVLIPRSSPRWLTWSAAAKVLRSSPRIAVVAAVMLTVGIGLRLQRDQALMGRTSSTIDGQSLVRRTSVAMNITQFDSFMLVVRDQRTLEPPGVSALRSSVEIVVPSVLRRDTESRPTPGVIVAQRYVAGRKNGWPLSAPGDWFFILRLPGIVLGAALSAAAAAVLGRWAEDQSDTRVAGTSAVVWIWGSAVAPGGIWMNTPTRALAVMVPLLGVLTIARLFDSSEDTAPYPMLPADPARSDQLRETWPSLTVRATPVHEAGEHA
jgi:hypothetical protein